MIIKGGRIWVRPSESLGTDGVMATIMSIRHMPGEIPQYPDGLLAVLPDDADKDEKEFYEQHPDGEATTVDFNGYVYSGPPLDGYLVMFP